MSFAAGTAAGLGRQVDKGPAGRGRCCRCFPLAEFAIEFVHFQGAGGDLVEVSGRAGRRAASSSNAPELGKTPTNTCE
jgi:hypothetical protein